MQIPEQFNSIFESELIEEMIKRGTPVSIPSGKVILDIGQTVRTMPLILSGLIKVSRLDDQGNELFLYYVNPQESCAMTFTCCMQQYPSEIRAVAEEDTDILMLPVSVMDEWLVKYPTWKSFVMRTIHFRFQELLGMVDQIAFQKLDERLVHYLNEKARVTNSPLLNLSHEQVANDLATSRVVVSRLLKKLENEKKLLLYRNQIRLLKEL
jgi:CRP/FNR family transcriptional regulator